MYSNIHILIIYSIIYFNKSNIYSWMPKNTLILLSKGIRIGHVRSTPISLTILKN